MERIFIFAVTELALSLSPGPAIFLVVSQALQKGFRDATFCIAGILLANLLYFTLSAFGLGVVISENIYIFKVVKTLGALYLLWFAFEIARELFSKNKEKMILKITLTKKQDCLINLHY